MIATALVAVSFASARLAASVPEIQVSELWIGLAISALVSAGLSLIATFPTVFAMLRLHSVWVGIVIQCGYVSLVSAVVWTAMLTVIPRRPTYWILFGITTSIVSCAAAISAAMLSLRLLGFRLTLRNDMRQSPQEAATPEFP